MSEFLSKEDRAALTGYKTSGRQANWLQSKGLPFRRDGSRIIVAHRHVQQWLEGKSTKDFRGMNLAAIK